MLWHQTKFGCKKFTSSEDIVGIAILWLYKPLLWPWRQHPNSFAWHTGSGRCTTIPRLDAKGSAVQKSSSGHSLANRYTKRRTQGHGDSSISLHPTPPHQHFYMEYNKTWKTSNTKLKIFRKCYETTRRQGKSCESLVNKHYADSIFYSILLAMLNILGYQKK